MATKAPKDPAFPHPTLEVGVPQYPTPNVPDFYKKDGHIILVDKISADKGSYNPQPLDGSITYAGRDANKFPSTLYLVRQTPSPDGLYVYRTWANDRTTASQDPWNYGVGYSSENPAFPIYTREYITPRSQYSPIAIGAVDPVFGGTAIVVKQEMKELGEDNPLRSRYVQVVVQYETIPGPVIGTSKVDPFTGTIPYSESEQIVVSGQTASIPKVGVVQEYMGIDSIKSKLGKKDFTSLIGKTWTEYETVSYTFPSYIIFNSASPNSINSIVNYKEARSFRVQATIQYKIITANDWSNLVDAPVNFSTITLTTDFGTFPNVIHNAESVLAGGVQLPVLKASVSIDSPLNPIVSSIGSYFQFDNNISPSIGYRNYFANGGSYTGAIGNNLHQSLLIPIAISNTIIKEMGGLRLLKITYVGVI
jgi:hypothetical protein